MQLVCGDDTKSQAIQPKLCKSSEAWKGVPFLLQDVNHTVQFAVIHADFSLQGLCLLPDLASARMHMGFT